MNDWMKIFWITLRILGKSGWEIYDKFGSFLFSFSPFPLSLYSIQRSFCNFTVEGIHSLCFSVVMEDSDLFLLSTACIWVLRLFDPSDTQIFFEQPSQCLITYFFIANGFLNIPFSTHFYLVEFNSVHEVLLTWLSCTPSICMQNQGFYLHDVNQLPVTNTAH